MPPKVARGPAHVAGNTGPIYSKLDADFKFYTPSQFGRVKLQENLTRGTEQMSKTYRETIGREHTEAEQVPIWNINASITISELCAKKRWGIMMHVPMVRYWRTQRNNQDAKKIDSMMKDEASTSRVEPPGLIFAPIDWSEEDVKFFESLPPVQKEAYLQFDRGLVSEDTPVLSILSPSLQYASVTKGGAIMNQSLRLNAHGSWVLDHSLTLPNHDDARVVYFDQRKTYQAKACHASKALGNYRADMRKIRDLPADYAAERNYLESIDMHGYEGFFQKLRSLFDEAHGSWESFSHVMRIWLDDRDDRVPDIAPRPYANITSMEALNRVSLRQVEMIKEAEEERKRAEEQVVLDALNRTPNARPILTVPSTGIPGRGGASISATGRGRGGAAGIGGRIAGASRGRGTAPATGPSGGSRGGPSSSGRGGGRGGGTGRGTMASGATGSTAPATGGPGPVRGGSIRGLPAGGLRGTSAFPRHSSRRGSSGGGGGGGN